MFPQLSGSIWGIGRCLISVVVSVVKSFSCRRCCCCSVCFFELGEMGFVFVVVVTIAFAVVVFISCLYTATKIPFYFKFPE